MENLFYALVTFIITLGGTSTTTNQEKFTSCKILECSECEDGLKACYNSCDEYDFVPCDDEQ